MTPLDLFVLLKSDMTPKGVIWRDPEIPTYLLVPEIAEGVYLGSGYERCGTIAELRPLIHDEAIATPGGFAWKLWTDMGAQRSRQRQEAQEA